MLPFLPLSSALLIQCGRSVYMYNPDSLSVHLRYIRRYDKHAYPFKCHGGEAIRGVAIRSIESFARLMNLCLSIAPVLRSRA